VATLRTGRAPNGEVDAARLTASGLTASDAPAILDGADTFIVAVPTDVDRNHQPDLRPLLGACATVGPHLRAGDVVIFESTVWPGLTQEICGPALERAYGLKGRRQLPPAVPPPATASTRSNASSRSSPATTTPPSSASPPSTNASSPPASTARPPSAWPKPPR